MPALKSHVDVRDETYRANRAAQLALLAELDTQLELAIAGGGERYQQRHRERGRLLARERIELLLDPDSPFLELSSLAAWGTEFTVGASVVTGVGVVSGVECVIIAHDPTVRGGAMNPYSLRKGLRALEIARANRLPVMNLVESGGADLPSQADLFVPGGRTFHELTELSANAVPTVALVFGNSTAGGAYVPGMCDYAVLVDRQAKVFLGGPPLVKMATGEEADDESLGGADMHSRTSGLSDYFAVDEYDAIRIGREIMARVNWRKQGPPPGPAAEPRYDPDEILGIVSADVKVPFDPREILARVVDDSDFDEYKPLYGTSLVTGWARVHGYPVGVLANHRGVLFSEESQKAAEFILLANQTDTPLVFLQNTTGYMVGRPLRAGRHPQGRRQDDQRGDQLGRPAPHHHHGLLVRRGQLRHVRPRLRPAVRLRLAGCQTRRDGRRPAGRGALDRRPGERHGGRAEVRRGDGPGPHGRDRGPDRGRVARLLRHRPAVRRRHHRSARHPHRPGPDPVGRALRPGGRPPRLRRVPDVTPMTKSISKLLIANRGEIAARVIRTAHALGIATVAVYSDPDADAPYVTLADEAVRLPGAAPAETYLRGEAIIAAATHTAADAVHPGYGFLSENAAFARACADAGLIFVGPSPATIEAMGDKLAAKAMMAAAGVPVLPFATEGAAAAANVGFPLLVKAAFGGGGRGMRLVTGPAELTGAISAARREAAAAFGDGTVFLERYVPDPRHVEVQILGDAHGGVIHLFERECSIQRRYQKIVEECPSPAVGGALRAALTKAAVTAGRAVGYTGAGTVEFVLDRDGSFYFLEMNTRLQVEHPVTEEVTGLDLVELQLRIAEGEPLPPEAREAAISGHAIEARLYAEDVRAGFLPVTGTLHRFAIPSGPGLRIDTGYRDGSVVSPHYDAMLAKVIAHGRSRADAARRLARALQTAEIHGLITNRDLLVAILREPDFLAGATDTGYLTRHEPARAAIGKAAAARHALAAALARQAVNRAGAPVLGTLPSGWRNVFSAPQRVSFTAAGEQYDVAYRVLGATVQASVNGVPFGEARLREARPDRVDLEVDGTRRVYRVHRVGPNAYVDTSDGSSALTEIPRFGDQEKQAAAGSLLAPMPGLVRRVLVEVGATVTAGQPLLVLEAMKMEQTVAAPAAGVVAELRAKAGEQVAAGQVLAIVEAGTVEAGTVEAGQGSP